MNLFLPYTCPQLKAKGSGSQDDFYVRVSGVMEASSFNVKVVGWEPLVEPWRPEVKAWLKEDNHSGRMTVNVEIVCSEVRCL